MSSETAQFRSAYVSIVLLWLLAQQAPAAGNQDTPLRHGTLLLSSITLLDKPLAEPASRSLQSQPDAEGNALWRCCLSVTAYTEAVQYSSSSAHSTAHAQQAHGPHASTAPAASYETCSNTTSSSCMEALLQESAHSDMTLYKVALLLPGQPTGQHTPPAGASAVPAGGTSTIQATSSITGYSSQHASLESNAADSPAASTATAGPPPTAVAAAQHSRMQDMLLTVHAEQELAGQVFLVVTTQLIRAGAGVVKVAVNMSHYSHTWQHPDALHAAPSLERPTPRSCNISTQQDIAEPCAPAAAADTLSDQLPDPTANTTATIHNGPPMLPQDSTAAAPPAQAHPAVAASATPESFPAFLPASMRAHLGGDPAALSVYLQHVLGHGTAAAQPAVAQTIAHFGGSSSCPKLPDESDSTAVTAWTVRLQAVLSTCPSDASLHTVMHASAALAQGTFATPLPAQHLMLLSDVAALPAVAAVAQVVLSSGLPVVSTATPEQLVLLMTAAVVLLMLLLRLCRSGNRMPCPEQLETGIKQQWQQQQAAANRAQVSPTATQDAGPFQQQDQQQDHLTLEEHLQDMDTDPFGYGAPPAALPAQAAAAVAGGCQPGSVLAAAQALQRASAMAAGEAAGALKDAFMRRHINQQGHSDAAPGLSDATAGSRWVAATAAAERDWLMEDDEDRVNQAPETIQRQLQAGGRWQRDGEGRLVRGSWKAVRNSLAAAAQAVMAAVGSGGKAAAAAADGGLGQAAGEGAGDVASGGWAEGENDADAAALQQLLSAAPGAVVGFFGN